MLTRDAMLRSMRYEQQYPSRRDAAGHLISRSKATPLPREKLEIGGKYNWVKQPERLVYLGKLGCWHQFEKVDEPGKVWCEVLDSDLRMIEKTEDA